MDARFRCWSCVLVGLTIVALLGFCNAQETSIPETWNYSGRVVDTSGKPIAGASVSLAYDASWNPQPGGSPTEVLTDKDGKFAVSRHFAGTNRYPSRGLRIVAKGFPPVYVRSLPTSLAGMEIKVAPAARLAGCVLIPVKGGFVGVPNMPLTLRDYEGRNLNKDGPQCTDADGSFNFPELPTQDYEKDDHSSLVPCWFGCDLCCGGKRINVRLDPGEVLDDVQVFLPEDAPWHISGDVREEPSGKPITSFVLTQVCCPLIDQWPPDIDWSSTAKTEKHTFRVKSSDGHFEVTFPSRHLWGAVRVFAPGHETNDALRRPVSGAEGNAIWNITVKKKPNWMWDESSLPKVAGVDIDHMEGGPPERIASPLNISANAPPVKPNETWGENTGGLRCRLRVSKLAWGLTEPVRLKGDVRNAGKTSSTLDIPSGTAQ